MSDFECPKCGDEVDMGNFPDHLIDLRNNRFEWECDCGCSFDVEVEWEPSFIIDENTIKHQQEVQS